MNEERKAYLKAWRESHADEIRVWRKRHYEKHGDKIRERSRLRGRRVRPTLHGLTLEQFQDRLVTQGGLCAICQRPFGDSAAYIDHDHSCCPGMYSCGRCVRGLVCVRCNTGLAMFGDDRVGLLAALDYLTRFENIAKEVRR